jgi:hypothetical protein
MAGGYRDYNRQTILSRFDKMTLSDKAARLRNRKSSSQNNQVDLFKALTRRLKED